MALFSFPDGKGRVHIGDSITMIVVFCVINGQAPSWCKELVNESLYGVDIPHRDIASGYIHKGAKQNARTNSNA